MNLETTVLNHNTYGGTIYQNDFCTDYEGTRNIASRIATDWKFDEMCRKNIEFRKRNGYRNVE